MYTSGIVPLGRLQFSSFSICERNVNMHEPVVEQQSLYVTVFALANNAIHILYILFKQF